MNDELLTLLMGKCWHSVEYNVMSQSWICSICNEEFREGDKREADNPDFSDPRHLYEFFAWLCRERREMWEGFTDWIDAKGERDLSIPAPWLWSKLIPWLFFQSPARPRDLMAEWLRLDEVREKFGTTEVCSEFNRWHNPCPPFCDKCDDGSGKVLAPWARWAKEGK